MAGARSAATRLAHSSLFLLSRSVAAATTRRTNLPSSSRALQLPKRASFSRELGELASRGSQLCVRQRRLLQLPFAWAGSPGSTLGAHLGGFSYGGENVSRERDRANRYAAPGSLGGGIYRIIQRMASSVGSNGYSAVTRVLFCGHYWPASTIYTKEYLQNYPFIQVDEVGLEQVPDVIQNYHICVVKNKCIDSDIIAKATQMKIIMQYGVGLEGVDINAATEQKIKVARIPGSTTGNAIACAEMAIYLTLGVLRKQKEMDTAVIRKDLGLPVGETIFGKTILILGFGAIGMEIAKRLRPFGVKILATKRNWSSNTVSCDLDGLVDKKGGPEDMHGLAREADIVITCMTLNNESVGIVDHKFLSALKKGSYLINIARGRLLDYTAVFNHLESGHLGGLGIDVAWTEPFDPEDPILKFPNVIITPHIAGITEYSYRTMAKVVGDVALKLHAGEPFTEIEFVN